jgi:beta-lactamase regulating signal transducer with metallopeptidase domain
MNGPYLLRLLCLCLASFFAVNAAAGLLISFASRAAVRSAESMRARSAARFLLAMRLLPSVAGISAVLALCVPSYLWLEPQASSERIGWACLALALLGAAGWVVSLAGVTRALVFSARFNRACQQTGCETLLHGESAKALVVEKDTPLLALTGVFRPHLIVSQAVLRSLSAEELELVLQHENAHRSSRDNLKRFFLLLAPAPVPLLRGFSSIERCWAKFSEWAADDEAVRGDSHRALSLAAALLRVARMGAPPRLSFLHTSLCAEDHDLSARVERLLRVQPLPAKSQSSARTFAIGSSFAIVVCAGILLAWPATLSLVHRLLELFLR